MRQPNKVLNVRVKEGSYAVADELSRLLLADKKVINPDNIDPLELAYLMFVGEFKVYMDNRPLTLNDVLKPGDLEKFIVYLDLRNRGLYAKPVRGGRVDFLVWDKKRNALADTPSYMVKILDEGRGIRTSELLELASYAERQGMKLILALVSSEGTLTYYRAYSIELSQRDSKWLKAGQ